MVMSSLKMSSMGVLYSVRVRALVAAKRAGQARTLTHLAPSSNKASASSMSSRR